MITEDILRMVLIGSGAVLLLALAVAAIELVRTLRRVRKTIVNLEPTITQMNTTVAQVNSALETIDPALKRVDPLLERVSLTVDAVNLEIMRADQILADISDVTDVASGAVKKVSNITDAPLNLLASATDKVRNIFTENKTAKKSRAAAAQGFAGGEDTDAPPPPPPCPDDLAINPELELELDEPRFSPQKYVAIQDAAASPDFPEPAGQPVIAQDDCDDRRTESS
ncbi:MAG: hypothetical protein FWF30_03225 [Coriobacteriia bacterium]|nr:hypothetical protein [Coriobacteriia bacterium]